MKRSEASFEKFIRETYPPNFFDEGNMTHVPGPHYRKELEAAFLAGVQVERPKAVSPKSDKAQRKFRGPLLRPSGKLMGKQKGKSDEGK